MIIDIKWQKRKTNRNTFHKPVSVSARPSNSGVLSSISAILETGHSGQARVQQSECRLPDQIVVKGNSHMNVIHAQTQALGPN